MDIKYNGATIRVPDGTTEADLAEILSTISSPSPDQGPEGGEATPTPSAPPAPQMDESLAPTPEDAAATGAYAYRPYTGGEAGGMGTEYRTDPDTIKREDFQKNQAFLNASRIIWKAVEGTNWDEPRTPKKVYGGRAGGVTDYNSAIPNTDDALANYGLQKMAELKDSLLGVNGSAAWAAWAATASPEQRAAMLYLWDQSDKLGTDWTRAGQFVVNQASDPANYIAITSLLPSLGSSTLAKVSAKVVSNEALRSVLRAGLRMGTEGYLLGFAKNATEQLAENQAAGQGPTMSLSEANKAGLGTALVTAPLGVAVDAGAMVLGRDAAPKVRATPEMEQALSGEAPIKAPTESVEPVLAPDGTPIPKAAETPPTALPEAPMTPSESAQAAMAAQQAAPPAQPLDPNAPIRHTRYDEAVDAAVKKGSVTRKDIVDGLKVTDREAKEIITRMEYDGIVEAPKPGKPRQVVKTADEVQGIRDAYNASRQASEAALPDRTLPKDTPAPTVQDLVAAVKEAVPEGTMPKTFRELADTVTGVRDILTRMGISDMRDAGEVLTKMGMQDAERSVIAKSVQDLNDNLAQEFTRAVDRRNGAKTEAERVAANKEVTALQDIQSVAAEMDAYFGSNTAFTLGQRANGIMTGDLFGATVDDMLKKQGITNPSLATTAQREAAQQELADSIRKATVDARKTNEVKAKIAEAEKAAKAGETDKMLDLLDEADDLADELAAKKLEEAGLPARLYEQVNKAIRVMNEVNIGAILSPRSLAMNIVGYIRPTIQPILNAYTKGLLTPTAMREMIAAYTTMATHARAAFYMGVQRWRFELDPNAINNWLEAQPEIGGKLGGFVRTIPRAMASADAVMRTVVYRSYVAAEATGQAFEKAAELVKQGLMKPEEVSAFVQKAVEDHLSKAYEKVDDFTIMRQLREVGKRKGLKGEDLKAYIVRELTNNAEYFKRATNEQGREYADDMLYNRAFSGKSTISKAAQGYEAFLNKHPVGRWIGNVFFRTPVRLGEFMLRTTPIYNVIAPNFVKDLMGSRGAVKQVIAESQLLISQAMGAASLIMYSSGAFQAYGPNDPSQRKAVEQTKEFRPLTIKLANGKKLVIRNMDLLSQMKVIGSALDRMQNYRYRKAQGEYVDNRIGQLIDLTAVAYMPFVDGIREMNTTQGWDKLLKIYDAMVSSDPDAKVSDAASDWFAGVITMPIPKIWQQARVQSGEGVYMPDTKTFVQKVMYAVDPQTPYLPRKMDAFGMPMKFDQPSAALTGFEYISDDDRKAWQGLSDKQVNNRKAWAMLAYSADRNLLPKYNVKELPGIDLRSEYTPDGKETLYNRIGRYMQESTLEEEFYQRVTQPMMSRSGVLGNKDVDGELVKTATEIMNKYRQEAINRLMREDPLGYNTWVQSEQGKAKAQQGKRDNWNNPFIKF